MVFVFFQLGSDEPLGIDKGLFTDIFLRRLVGVAVADLDVISEYFY